MNAGTKPIGRILITNDDGYDAAHGVTTEQSSGDADGSKIECVSGNPGDDYDYATEIIDHFGGNRDLVANLGYESMLGDTGIDVELAGTMLQVDNTSIATTPANALRIGAHFKYSKPIPITESTVGFKLNFATTRGVSLDADQNDDNHIYMSKVGADPFTIQVQTRTRKLIRRSRGAWN